MPACVDSSFSSFTGKLPFLPKHSVNETSPATNWRIGDVVELLLSGIGADIVDAGLRFNAKWTDFSVRPVRP